MADDVIEPEKREEAILAHAITATTDRLREMLLRKNRQYGASAFKAPPLMPDLPIESAILVRMGDKIERLLSLAKNGVLETDDERREDTMLDLAGYIVLYLAYGANKGDLV